ncbi:MAG: PAS domain S-box protein [Desulfobacterales bacterium]|nr:PAS domain S-box protein [Desulfobacterales bacterium]
MKPDSVAALALSEKVKELQAEDQKPSLVVPAKKLAIKSLEAVFHIAPDIALQYIDQDGTVFKWNRTSERLYGYSENEVVGRHIQEVLLPEPAAQEFTALLNKVWKTGKPMSPIGWHIRSAGGDILHVRASAVPVLEQNKPIALCCMQVDATDTKRGEDLLMQLNRNIEKQVAQRTAELQHLNQTLQTEIAERARMQDALLESERRFRIFADYNYAWEYWVGPDLNMVYVSPSCERITGYRAGEFMENRKLLFLLVHPEDQPKFNCLKSETACMKSKNQFDFRIMTRSGRLRWISHICQPVFSETGEFLGRRASNRDITDQRWAEAELRATRKELEHRVEERTESLRKTNTELDYKQRELLQQQAATEKLNQELLETNKAVSILAKNIEKTKKENEKKIAAIISAKIMPIINQLRKDARMEKGRPDLDVITAYLNELTSHLDDATTTIMALSAMEANVATLIGNGLSTNEIAARLNISILTVKTHRKNIRKKLHIQNTDENLANYLKSRMRR